ncbi:MAG: glycosyltransferase family 39 protein [Candidatus Aminicenantales bacterium]
MGRKMASRAKKINLFFLGIFLLGAWIRALDVGRPADGRVRESWRECDYAALARNFYRESMNPLYPKIDWRGSGPGYAEMEFPAFPWMVAALYKIFGYHEVIGRLLAYVFSLLAVLIFFCLARYLLPPFGAAAASLFFVLSPLAVRISNSLQPEGLMLLLYMAAALAFIRWLDDERRFWYGTALAASASVFLIKVPSVHIGLFFLLLLAARKGWKGLRMVRTWIFAAAAVLPAFAWYLHAHRLWLLTGNSLGVSNEYHWIGWDLLQNPTFLLRFVSGLLRTEVLHVWMPLGGFAALVAVLFRFKNSTVRTALFWLLSVGLYYLIAIRTTGDNWAAYYHVVTVPPAAILLGVGAEFVRDRIKNHRRFIISWNISIGLGTALILGKWLFKVSYPGYGVSALGLICIAGGISIVPFLSGKRRRPPAAPLQTTSMIETAAAYIGLLGLLSVFLFEGFHISRDLHPQAFQSKYACARIFQPFIPEGVLILASGGPSSDETGRPVAFNAPYFFFWLDRKGFNIPQEKQSVEKVQSFIRQGARYYVLEKEAAKAAPGFKEELQKRFRLLSECKDAYLFEL